MDAIGGCGPQKFRTSLGWTPSAATPYPAHLFDPKAFAVYFAHVAGSLEIDPRVPYLELAIDLNPVLVAAATFP